MGKTAAGAQRSPRRKGGIGVMGTPMNILALSTSTQRGSAAVFDDGAELATVAYADLKGHAERIFAAIDAALAEAGLPRAALSAVACDTGPGSFTGARVGVASVKGIALALGLPVVGVLSLEAMAAAAFGEGAAREGDVVLAAIDAKKSEIFVAAYALDGGSLQPILPPCCRAALPEALTLPGQERRVIVVGEVAAALGPCPALARGPALDLPDAAWVARLAAARLARGAGLDPAALEPTYVRAPDAIPLAAAPGGGSAP
jgi:tRNA threonylcarbamoyladenosine biosynthesis protein TsaB